MSRPLILDLYCGAGGAAMGYWQAGFDLIGVDSEPRRNYPFPFIQADALDVLRRLEDGPPVVAVHASPPCQAHSVLSKRHADRQYPDLIEPTRQLLQASGLPYVIENVPHAPLHDPVMLCGTSLGLPVVPCRDRPRRVWRHRHFELHGFTAPTFPCDHSIPALGVYGKGYWSNVGSDRRGGYQGSKRECELGMEIGWHMNQVEIAQAIPPAYTRHLGYHLLLALGARTQPRPAYSPPLSTLA